MTTTAPEVPAALLLALPLDYDAMTAKEIVAALPAMGHGARTAVRAYETANRHRAGILHRLDQLAAADERAVARTLAGVPVPERASAPEPTAPVVRDLRPRSSERRQTLALAAFTATMVASVAIVGRIGF